MMISPSRAMFFLMNEREWLRNPDFLAREEIKELWTPSSDGGIELSEAGKELQAQQPEFPDIFTLIRAGAKALGLQVKVEGWGYNSLSVTLIHPDGWINIEDVGS